MFGIGPLELLVIAVILFFLVGVPIIAIAAVIAFVAASRQRSPKDRE